MDEPFAENVDDGILGLEDAPEFFVEGYHGVLYRAGVLKLNMFSMRVSGPSQALSRQAACILSIPLVDLKALVPALAKIIEHLERQDGSGTEEAK